MFLKEDPIEVLYVLGGADNADILSDFPELKKFSKKSLLVMNLSKSKDKLSK